MIVFPVLNVGSTAATRARASPVEHVYSTQTHSPLEVPWIEAVEGRGLSTTAAGEKRVARRARTSPVH
jgi:hypothetical protein